MQKPVIWIVMYLISLASADEYMKREFSLVKPYQGKCEKKLYQVVS